MGEGAHRDKVVCACVALNWDKQALETFDTHNCRYKDWDLIQFLTASSDAPVYFTTPYTVVSPSGEGTDYIDGGLGANCPAVQGIDLAKERFIFCCFCEVLLICYILERSLLTLDTFNFTDFTAKPNCIHHSYETGYVLWK